MKAAFIHDHYFVYNDKDGKYYDGSGGVFTASLWSRYLAIFDSLVVVGRAIDTLPNQLSCSSCERVSFELVDCLKNMQDRYFNSKLIWQQLDDTLSKVDFAIIRLPSTLGYVAQQVCISKGIKYVLEVVGCPWDAYMNHSDIRGKLIAPFEFFKLRNATKKSENTIYVTQEFLQNRYPTYGKSIGISNVNIQNTVSPKRFKEVPSVFKLGLIGSFHVKYKGHIEALNALKFILDKAEIKNIKLYLVGTGDSSWVVDYAKKVGVYEAIEIIGAVEAGENGIFPFLDKLDLYIHPSKQEGLPRVVIEALSRGKLVLGSSVAGMPELLEKKYLHKPGDWKQLANDIISLYQDFDNWDSVVVKNIEKSNLYLESKLQNDRVCFIKSSYE